MFFEKPKDFSSNTVETKPAINTKERWLEFAHRLFNCSIGSKDKEEVIAYLEFLRELINTAKLFIPLQSWDKWKKIHQNISLDIKQILDQQEESISVNYDYCTNIIAGLKYEVRFTQKNNAAEDSEIIRAKEDIIMQINDILLSSSDDSFVISKGIELLKEAFWLIDNNIKDEWEQTIANISGNIRDVEIMAKDAIDFNYEEEINKLGKIIRRTLLELIKALK